MLGHRAPSPSPSQVAPEHVSRLKAIGTELVPENPELKRLISIRNLAIEYQLSLSLETSL